MIPSSEEVAKNLRRHCEGMAREIARRIADEWTFTPVQKASIESHALAVLLDWYLGDFIPNRSD